MTLNAKALPVLLLTFSILSGAPLLAQTPGGTPGAGTSSGASSVGEAKPGIEDKETKEQKICAAICGYSAAISPSSTPKQKATASAKLISELREVFPSLADSAGNSKDKTGECMCPDGNGGEKEITYRIATSTGNASASGREDFVIALAGDQKNTKVGKSATATNNSKKGGVAIASAGDQAGNESGGEATATSASGDAYAAGGASGGGTGGDATATSNGGGTANAAGGAAGGSNSGGSATASSTAGSASAVGGAGGNSGGMRNLVGGQGGMATAWYGPASPFVGVGAFGTTGYHGVGAWAWAAAQAGASGPGGTEANN